MQNLEEEDVDPETEINRRWERVASVYRESNDECLGFRQRGKKKEWTWKAAHGKLSTAGAH